jgi:hypothetical protein
MSKRDRLVLFAIHLFVPTICGGIAIIGLHCLFSYLDSKIPVVETVQETTVVETAKAIKMDKKEKPLYNITPGYTYYTDKGNIKLYADIIPMDNGNIFVIGEEFYNDSYSDTHMEDASIKEELHCQENNIYMNSDNNLIVTLSDNYAVFTDNRPVSLPFNGKLDKIDIPVETSDISEDETNAEVDTNKVTDIKVDEYSENSTAQGIYVGKDFEKFLDPNYEKKDLSITAKYIETDSNNGVKYQDIYSGKYFYVFGGGYNYDSSVCNTVTITGTYRGIEKRFNGLEMDDKYPCFVIKSMRKPTKEEVGS